MALPQTSNGKIARLPARLREAVNRRLHDGETAAQIMAWLNAEPEALKVFELHFEGQPVNEQNLSAWRMGGFQRWLKDRESNERLKERAIASAAMAKASGHNLAAGALAQLTAELMELQEELQTLRQAGEEIDPRQLKALTDAFVSLRGKELEAQALALNVRKANQKDRELNLAAEKWQLQFAETFLKHLDDARAREIAMSGDRQDVKIENLRAHLFGPRPSTSAEAAA